jgi:hypothetical protein
VCCLRESLGAIFAASLDSPWIGKRHERRRCSVTYDYPGNTSSMTGKVRDEGNIVRVGVNFRLDHAAQ